ncbi:MAG TPA: NAD(P)/FAD-dependent oxidoreductase [Pyrinomonadaceae bacterium]|nr:NAD(P)/FAD-dependent oxidoreductase [Pyrinomonadaceae bacterium]
MKDFSDKMLIIGAGPCGLGVAKALKEAGIAYEQVEADREVGGNWYHGVYETAHIISSRKTTEYADFPMPADYPDFPSRKQMSDYYKLYADTFNLRENIRFNAKVVMCRPLENETWEVETADGEKRIYKGVVVCNGHHWDKRFPSYAGEFTGETIHSKDYKTPEQLVGKRVLVIGGGNSACDIASEAARVAKEAHLSLRRGYWFLPKTLFGKPSAESPAIYLPVFLQRIILKMMLRVVVGRYEDYGLPRPDHKLFEHHPTVSGEILHYLKHGRIEPHKDIERFAGKTVHFVDGTSAEVDLIVCATGFYVSFPFLPEGLVPVKNDNIAQLYAGSVLPDYKNLYVFGTQQIRYGVGPLITPAANLLAKMIKLQERMELPIGLVLKESGAKLPTTHLVDPIPSLRRMRIADRTLPLLLRKEKKLRKRFAGNPKNKSEPVLRTNPDMQVY